MAGAVSLMSAQELSRRLGLGDPLTVLDVRENDERAYASIPIPSGVVDLHVPLGELSGRIDEVETAAAGRPLVIYCHHGQRSMVAASWLARKGWKDVANLEGGIDAWSTRVDPAVKRY